MSYLTGSEVSIRQIEVPSQKLHAVVLCVMENADRMSETPGVRVPKTGEPAVKLRYERERRRMTREEFARAVGISPTWLRDIEAGEPPGAGTKERIRAALERCPIHAEFGVECNHKLPVPNDEDLYAPILP